MNITIIGTGYVGLVTGACFANAGHNVCCLDNNKQKIENLKKGIVPIFEPGIDTLVKENLAKGTLQFQNQPQQAIENAQLIFIAVGTPPDEDGSADLFHVLAVAKTIGKFINGEKVIITKSTVPVGTAEKVEATIKQCLQQRAAKHDFSICSNPEFLKEGSAVNDFNNPDRIIIGTRENDERAKQALTECYAPFSQDFNKLIFMGIRSSELTKYAANSMLATKISFINELANIADAVGADIEAVRVGIGSDNRIGYQFIYAGAGYGGSCFPKDVRALIQTASQEKINPHLLTAVEQVNENQKKLLFQKLATELGSIKNKTIAVWGLAFKPNTDDMRNAVSLVLCQEIFAHGGKVQAFDPIFSATKQNQAQKLLGKNKNFKLVNNKLAATNQAHALVICTEWSEFKLLDFAELKTKMKTPIIIDGRNIIDKQKAQQAGFTYKGIGR